MARVQEQSPQERMIQQQVIDRGIRDPRVLAALRSIPREAFFAQSALRDAFADRPSAIGHGQTISTPHIVALMTQRLEVQPESRVLEIGTGTGYQTAILAQLAAMIYTVERIKPLLDGAFERLLGLNIRNVKYRYGDGTLGWLEEAPFDRILIGAGAPTLPHRLLQTHLTEGGVAVLPVGAAEQQMLVEVRKEGERLLTADICPCRFVKLIGQEGWTLEAAT